MGKAVSGVVKMRVPTVKSNQLELEKGDDVIETYFRKNGPIEWVTLNGNCFSGNWPHSSDCTS